MGELAAQQSYDPRVRDYGTKLKSDHTAHASEIERLLEPLGVTIPTEPSAEALAQHAALARLSGEEFDAAFVQMMIWTHTEAIEKYGAQTHANPDRSLHDFATQELADAARALGRSRSAALTQGNDEAAPRAARLHRYVAVTAPATRSSRTSRRRPC